MITCPINGKLKRADKGSRVQELRHVIVDGKTGRGKSKNKWDEVLQNNTVNLGLEKTPKHM